MATLLARQAAAFRREHGIPETVSQRRAPPPSLLFSPSEAKQHDAAAFAALAQHGLAAVSALEPDVAAYAPLFEGPARDREGISAEDHQRLSADIRRLLLLLSPHLQARAAQEIVEGLIHRYHVHIWNVSEVLACALPYHDSPMFTRLIQGLHVKGLPQWSWLQKLQEKPATLVRPAIAKYCTKDTSVLTFIGDIVMETARLQKANRPLATFFAALWLDTFAAARIVSPELAGAAMPPLLLLLRRPHLRDFFHAALLVAAALTAKVELEPGARGQLLDRVARQVPGEHGRAATSALSLLLQLDSTRSGLPAKALAALAAAGPAALVGALPPALDCQNLVATVLEASLAKEGSVDSKEEGERYRELASGLVADPAVCEQYAEPLALAAFQAFIKTSVEAGEQLPRAAAPEKSIRGALEGLGSRHPAALGAAFRRAADASSRAGAGVEPLVRLVAPACAVVATPASGSSSPGPAAGRGDPGVLPVVQAFAHRSPKVRSKAVLEAVHHLLTRARGAEGQDADRSTRFLASLVLQAAEDKSPEVVHCVLESEEFWTGLPQVDVAGALPVLESLISRLLDRARPSGDSLSKLFTSTLLEDPHVASLLPQTLRCFSWLYGREDCGEALRKRMDAFLLPLLALCAVGSEAHGAEGTPASLRDAVQAYCRASQHALLSCRKKPKEGEAGLGFLLRSMTKAADEQAALDLCSIVEGRFLLSASSRQVLLGGAAAQVAGASLLAGALPRLLEEVAAESADRSDRLLLAATRASGRLARHQVLGAPVCLEPLQRLLQASLAGVAASDQRGGGEVERRRRRKSGGGSRPQGLASEALQSLLLAALGRPKLLSEPLKQALALRPALLRPAALRLALAPAAAEAAPAAANALLLLRSCLLGKAPEWPADQTLLVPLLALLARTESKEVRAAAVAVLDALKQVGLPPRSPVSVWDSPCSTALREAGVFRSSGEVLPPSSWTLAVEQLIGAAGLSDQAQESFLAHALAHRAELLQDNSAAALCLAKYLGSKAGGTRAARGVASAFWATGIAMLAAGPDGLDPPSLLPAVPAAAAINGGLKDLLPSLVAETLGKLREAAGTPGPAPPALLRVLAVLALALARAGPPPDAAGDKARHPAAEALDAFVRTAALPFCTGLAELFEAGTPLGHNPQVVELAALLCDCLASVSSSPADKDGNRASAAAGLFRLAAASGSAAGQPEPGAEAEAPPEGAAVPQAPRTVAVASAAALAAAALDLPALRQLLAESGALKAKQLATPRGCAASELLSQQIAGYTGSLAGADELFVALGKACAEAASQHAKAESSGKQLPEPPALLHLFLAVAALAEHVRAAKGSGEFVPSVCKSVSEACALVAGKLSGAMVAAVVRFCGALAVVVPPEATGEGEEARLVDRAAPPPLQTCLDCLRAFGAPLGRDVMGLLRGNLRPLWRHPLPPKELEAQPAAWEGAAQARLRRLLLSATSTPALRPEDVEPTYFLAFAQAAGVQASLDFVVLQLVLRRLEHPVSKKKAAGKKRRARAKEEEEELAELGVSLDDPVDTIGDEAMAMLLAAGPQHRYHCFGNLAQTLCALASAIRAQPRKGAATTCWGLKLLPDELLAAQGADRLAQLLDAGLSVACRFVSEHGLPNDLDEADFDATHPRRTTAPDDAKEEVEVEAEGERDPELVPGAAAAAVCYAVWAACAVETLLTDLGAGAATAAGPCQARARELRQLLLRSLAVSHPATFFRALCLVLQVPDRRPPLLAGDLFSDRSFSSAVLVHALGAASEALQDRQELRAKQGLEGGLEADSQAACAPLCAAAMRHVTRQLLAADAVECPEASQEAAWRFVDGLCRLSGRSAPKPLLQLCFPAAAAALAARAASAARPGESVAVACCVCLQTAINELGRGILEKLPVVAPPLLDVASSSRDEASGLGLHVLGVLQAMVKAVGPFLSPYLGRLLSLTSSPRAPARTPVLEELGKEMVASVPHRLLLPAVQGAGVEEEQKVASLALGQLGDGLVRLQRLAVLQVWIFSQAPPDFVAGAAEANAAAILALFSAACKAAAAFAKGAAQVEDICEDFLGRAGGTTAAEGEKVDLSWAAACAKGRVLQLQRLAAAAFAQLALRLTLEDLRGAFTKLLEWARCSQANVLAKQGSRKTAADSELQEDTDAACRALAVAAAMTALAGEAPGVAEELLLPLALKDVCSAIVASRQTALRLAATHRPSGRKKRRGAGGAAVEPISLAAAQAPAEVLQGHTWWWLDVGTASLRFAAAALRPAGAAATTGKAVDEAVAALIAPCSDLIDTFEFLPPADASPVASALEQAVQGALVALAAAADGPKVKELLTTVLGKTRSDDVEVRLCAVRACHKVWSELGVQVVSGLSEVVVFASELLEDEDDRVEEAVRSLIKTIEGCTGESLQEAIKR